MVDLNELEGHLKESTGVLLLNATLIGDDHPLDIEVPAGDILGLIAAYREAVLALREVHGLYCSLPGCGGRYALDNPLAKQVLEGTRQWLNL